MSHVLLFLYASKATLFVALGLLYPAISSFLALSPTSRTNKKGPRGSRVGGAPPGVHTRFARCPASQLAAFCRMTPSDDAANIIWQEGDGPDGRAASGNLPNPEFADSLCSFGTSERNQGTKMGRFPEGEKKGWALHFGKLFPDVYLYSQFALLRTQGRGVTAFSRTLTWNSYLNRESFFNK